MGIHRDVDPLGCGGDARAFQGWVHSPWGCSGENWLEVLLYSAFQGCSGENWLEMLVRDVVERRGCTIILQESNPRTEARVKRLFSKIELEDFSLRCFLLWEMPTS